MLQFWLLRLFSNKNEVEIRFANVRQVRNIGRKMLITG